MDDNADGITKTIEALEEDTGELIFTNLADFDSMHGPTDAIFKATQLPCPPSTLCFLAC
jgi:phosphopentomutase